MGKKILAMSLALVMALSFTACAKEPSVQEIVDGVIEAWDDIRTYESEMDMSLDAAGELKGEAVEGTMVMKLISTLDVENRQMKIDITMNVAAPGEDEIEMGMEMYLIGDMVYMMMDVPVMGPTWMKSEIPEGTWGEMSQTEGQIELLEGAEVELIGSETIGGVDCYVLQLTPDMQQLWQTAMRQAEVTGQPMPEVAEESLEEMFRSFSVKQWVAKDTYFLTKAEVDMAVELTPEATGFPEEEGILTMDIGMDWLFYNYNQPVSIVLPPEAEEAIEVPMSGDSPGTEESEAAQTELANIQSAVVAVMVDNGIALLSNPVTVATNDMSAFPDATSVAGSADKLNDLNSNAYAVGDKDGFILYTHDITGDGAQTGLVNYFATQYTKGTYIVDASGTVIQVTTGYE